MRRIVLDFMGRPDKQDAEFVWTLHQSELVFVTNSGTPIVLATDAVTVEGFSVDSLGRRERAELRMLLDLALAELRRVENGAKS